MNSPHPRILNFIQPYEIYNAISNKPLASSTIAHKRASSNQSEEMFNFVLSTRKQNCNRNLVPINMRSSTPYTSTQNTSFRYHLFKKAILQKGGRSPQQNINQLNLGINNTLMASLLPTLANRRNQGYGRAKSRDYYKASLLLSSINEVRKYKKQSKAISTVKWNQLKRDNTPFKIMRTYPKKMKLFPFYPKDQDLDICKWENSDQEYSDFSNEAADIY